ncbi:MAG: hypothetical protein U9P68_09825 [Pseudomonadota bacterium]|nr:hypothetical protein [Pseudomonadota bacterium]
MPLSTDTDALVQFRVRLPARTLDQIDSCVRNGAFRDRTAVLNFALSAFLSDAAPVESSGIKAVEQTNGVALFAILLLLSRVLTDVERKHLYRIANAAADEGAPLAKAFIEEMGLHTPRETPAPGR